MLRFLATLAGAVVVVWVLSLVAAPGPEVVEGHDATAPDTGPAAPAKPSKPSKLTLAADPGKDAGIVKDGAKGAIHKVMKKKGERGRLLPGSDEAVRR